MKMKPEHYEKIKTAMKEKHEEFLKHKEYTEYNKKGYSVNRYAWDLFHASGQTPFACQVLYKYLNDDHISTAITKIWLELWEGRE